MFVTGAMLDYSLVQPTVAKRNVDTQVTSDLRKNSNKLYLLNIMSQNAIKNVKILLYMGDFFCKNEIKSV